MRQYGYCRISTRQQSIERQVRNIQNAYPNAIIRKEVYTGTRFQGRKELEKLLKVIKADDTLIFDSVSRMSRNASEGCELYETLFNKGVELVFLKEPHINTEVYRKAIERQITVHLDTGSEATDKFVNTILEALNDYSIALAKEQIMIAFEQSEKEVRDLQQRTREGMETARLNGKQIGQKEGTKLITKKSIEAKEGIKKYNRDFSGVLNDIETIRQLGISRKTFYKYKRELREELI